MSLQASLIALTSDEQTTLEAWVRAAKTEQRLALRARIVLAAAAGHPTEAIAGRFRVRAATVSKWRTRFARERLKGLLDPPPPSGHATWTGTLVARALGEVSAPQVWRVLRRYRIHLQRRRSWCVSTDPEFAAKAADIVGLYLAPPENAVVLAVDEKPSIQALERAQGYLRLPNGQALSGFSHDYERHGTTTLFAALNLATGQVHAGHYQRRRRREFLDFMNELVADYPGQAIHAILDNLNTHKPKRDRWLARHKHIHFHFTPTRASWLNQIECWFSILSRRALRGASFTSPQAVREAIDRFIEAYNKEAAPFEWRKAKVHSVPLKHSYA